MAKTQDACIIFNFKLRTSLVYDLTTCTVLDGMSRFLLSVNVSYERITINMKKLNSKRNKVAYEHLAKR